MDARQRLLIFILVALMSSAAIVLSGRLDLAPTILLPVASVAATVALIAALGPARGGVVSLLLMAALNRYTAEVGGTSLKPEHFAVPIVALVLLPRLPVLARRLAAVDLVLLAYLSWSVLGGLLNAPDPADSTRLWGMLLLAAFPYFAIVATVRNAGRIFAVVDVWFIIGLAVGLFGIATHVLYAWDVNLGIQVNPATRDPTVPSTFREANLFGSAMMILALSAISMLALDYRRKRLSAMTAIVAVIGLQVSFTRTAWGAFVIGLLLLIVLLGILWMRGAYRMPSTVFRPLIATGALVLVMSAVIWAPLGDRSVPDRAEQATVTATEEALPALRPGGTPAAEAAPTPDALDPDIVGRVGSITDTGDSSLRIRIDFAKQALRDWRNHPIVGNGIGSFGQGYTTTSFDRAWLSNTFVRTLHDSGIVGLGLFLVFLALLARSGLQLTNRLTGNLDRLALSLAVAVVGMFVAFQATEGFQLAWYWAVLGLYAAAVRLAHERRARAA